MRCAEVHDAQRGPLRASLGPSVDDMQISIFLLKISGKSKNNFRSVPANQSWQSTSCEQIWHSQLTLRGFSCIFRQFEVQNHSKQRIARYAPCLATTWPSESATCIPKFRLSGQDEHMKWWFNISDMSFCIVGLSLERSEGSIQFTILKKNEK